MKYVSLIPKIAKWCQVIAETVKFFIDKLTEQGLLVTDLTDNEIPKE